VAVEVHGERARVLLSLGRDQDAARAARDGLAADPQNWWLHGLLSLALYRMGRLGEALGAATTAVALAPEESWGHQLRALALRRLGRRRAAVAAASEAVRLDASSAEAWNVLSWAELGALHPRRARAAARRALELAPAATSGHHAMARVALDWGSPGEAERHCRAILAVDPGDADAMNLLGMALRRRLRPRAAIAAFAAAAELDPGNEAARHNLTQNLGTSVETAVVASLILAVFAAGLFGLVLEGDPVARVVALGALAAVFAAIAGVWVLAVRQRAVVPRDVRRGLRRQRARERRVGAGILAGATAAFTILVITASRTATGGRGAAAAFGAAVVLSVATLLAPLLWLHRQRSSDH